MRRKLSFKAVAAAALLAGTLALCLAQAPVPGAVDYLIRPGLRGAAGGHLIASISADPATFNRLFASGRANALVADQLCADLVHINRQTYELEPALAARWETAPDGRTYTVHLRRGLKFSDGSPFTADDVIFTLEALQDPKSESTIADQLRVDGKFPAVARLDNTTVRIILPRPVGTGLRAFDSIPILPRSRLLKAYQSGTLSQAWGPTADPAEIAGLGPFRLKEYQRGVRVVLERNPHYWKKDGAGQTLPYLDRLTFLVVPDRNAEALRFEAGELDVLIDMGPENFARLRRSSRAADLSILDLGPGLGMDFLWFNLNPGKKPSGAPWVDPEKQSVFLQAGFRRAVSLALDRAGISRSVFLGLGTPQFGPVSSGNKAWYSLPAAPQAYDPAQARSLLAHIGLKAGGDGILRFGARSRPFDLVLLTAKGNAARERSAEIIRQNLAAVGMRVSIQVLPPAELAGRFLSASDYEAILFGLTPTDIVPDLQTDLWYSSGRFHFWNPNQSRPGTPWEAEMDALIGKMVQSPDPQARKQAFNQVQAIWAQEMPAVATVAPNILCGWRRVVGNVRPSIMVPYLLWNTEELTRHER